MTNATTLSGILFLAFWSALFVYTGNSPLAGRTGPISYDPLFYPRLLIIAGAVLSVIVIASGLRVRKFSAGMTTRSFAIIAIAGAYLLLLKPFGFVFTSIALITALAAYTGYRKPVVLVATSVLLTIGTWLVFTQLLKAPLPAWPRFI